MAQRTRAGWTPVAALALGALVACGDDGDGTGGSDQYYIGTASAALGASSNEADCALCHSDDGTQEGFAGKTFMDIAYRTSFKGGDAETLLQGSNACVTGWMGGEALTEDDPAWTELEAYLQSISDESVTDPNSIAPEVLADVDAYAAKYEGGDASAGEDAYDLYCGKCHDEPVTVGASPAWTLEMLSVLSAGRIAQKVRTSGPPPSGTEDSIDNTPGPMPFFEPSDLSEEDLKDIIAHIKS